MPIQAMGQTLASCTVTPHPQKKGKKEMSKQHFTVCLCFGRYFRMTRAEPPEDIIEVFGKYSKNGIMSIDNLHRFLTDFQGEVEATKEDAQSIFNSLKYFNVLQRKGLHREAFFQYLLADFNLPISLSPGVHHDMSAPLAHYFIYTGHNSYLTGNQLTSHSSVYPIIKALKNGVRVIELDLWPNSRNNGVNVFHGGTLTSSVKLIKCLQAIKDNAFHASEYPVVITFEDHLNKDLQAKVAEMVNKTFGEMLYHPGSDFDQLPSPENLKGKIIISTKPPKEYLESKSMEDKRKEHIKCIPLLKIGRCLPMKDGSNESEHEQQEEDVHDEVPAYRDLIAIHAVKLKGDVKNWLETDSNKAKRLSLSEPELKSAVEKHGPEIVRFTQRNLLRVYPKGIRLDSSNYDPFDGWMHGAQMVAFNMQGYGKYLWQMQGMFSANNGCGYVKKPEFLCNNVPNAELFDPSENLEIKKTLKVKVYMGEGWHSDFHHTHFDKCSPPDFYARVGIAGFHEDSIMKETEVIKNEWMPAWNQEFEFPLTVPELALLRVEVAEYDVTKRNDFGGQTCLPVPELRTGIRCIPLRNEKGEKYRSVKLLMRFEFA